MEFERTFFAKWPFVKENNLNWGPWYGEINSMYNWTIMSNMSKYQFYLKGKETEIFPNDKSLPFFKCQN